MIVRHETGRVGRRAAVRVDCPRAAQVRGGRGVDARLQKLAALALAVAGLAGMYLLAVGLVRLGVLFGQAFIY